MNRRVLFAASYLLAVLFAGMPRLGHGFDAAHLQQLSQHARQLQLDEHPAWLALLHYKRESLLPRVLSQADDVDFFLAAQGKTDPRAELLFVDGSEWVRRAGIIISGGNVDLGALPW